MKKTNSKPKWLLFPLLVILAILIVLAARRQFPDKSAIETAGLVAEQPAAVENEQPPEKPAETVQNANPSSVEVQSNTLPNKVQLTVPFLVQAPRANWDALHEDACEEASLIMARHFSNGSSVSEDSGDREIKDLVDYETKNGYGLSITVSQLNDIARTYFNMKNGRVESASIEKIKAELVAGQPVIIPAAGKLLGNPNFKNGGPVYHMLVITGYQGDEFITNDPGTRHGQGYRYKQNILWNAIHDWNSTNINDGRKNYLVFGE